MPDQIIHDLTLQSDPQTRAEQERSRNLAEQSLLGEDTAAVSGISVGAGERTIEATLRGTQAAQTATEFDELWAANGFEEVAVFAKGTSSAKDGYYVLEDKMVSPADPRDDRIQEFHGTMAPAGTRSSHFRAISCTLRSVENPVDSLQTAWIGVPDTARKTCWFDPATGEYADAQVEATRTSEFGDVHLYDAYLSPFIDVGVDDYRTHLIYDVPYDAEWTVSTRLWDTHGSQTRQNDDGDTVWQRCYRTDHVFDGMAVLDNGLFQLRLDGEQGTLIADDYVPGADAYGRVSLPSTSWEPHDVDIDVVSPMQIGATIEFRDTTQSPTAYYTLRCVLNRGYLYPQWTTPNLGTQGAIPTGLYDHIEAMANVAAIDPQPARTLVRNSKPDVRVSGESEV